MGAGEWGNAFPHSPAPRRGGGAGEMHLRQVSDAVDADRKLRRHIRIRLTHELEGRRKYHAEPGRQPTPAEERGGCGCGGWDHLADGHLPVGSCTVPCWLAPGVPGLATRSREHCRTCSTNRALSHLAPQRGSAAHRAQGRRLFCQSGTPRPRRRRQADHAACSR